MFTSEVVDVVRGMDVVLVSVDVAVVNVGGGMGSVAMRAVLRIIEDSVAITGGSRMRLGFMRQRFELKP